MEFVIKKKLRHIFIVLAVLLVLAFASLVLLKNIFPLHHRAEVLKYSAENNIRPSLACAMIFVESRFRENALSPAGAKGLMQLTDSTFEWLLTKSGEKISTELIYDPEINIKYGTLNIGMLLSSFEDEATALAAYNAGRGRVRSWLENPKYSKDGISLDQIPYTETRNYVHRVKIVEKAYYLLYFFAG